MSIANPSPCGKELASSGSVETIYANSRESPIVLSSPGHLSPQTSSQPISQKPGSLVAYLRGEIKRLFKDPPSVDNFDDLVRFQTSFNGSVHKLGVALKMDPPGFRDDPSVPIVSPLDNNKGVDYPQLLSLKDAKQQVCLGKHKKPVCVLGAHGSKKYLSTISPEDGVIPLCPNRGDQSLTRKATNSIGAIGTVSSNIRNLHGSSPAVGLQEDRTEWVTVTGIFIDESIFNIDGLLPPLTTIDEVQRRFDFIRSHGQSVVAEFSPHYSDSKFCSFSPRLQTANFLDGIRGSGVWYRNMRCSGFFKNSHGIILCTYTFHYR